jgi:hypothetical protein
MNINALIDEAKSIENTTYLPITLVGLRSTRVATYAISALTFTKKTVIGEPHDPISFAYSFQGNVDLLFSNKYIDAPALPPNHVPSIYLGQGGNPFSVVQDQIIQAEITGGAPPQISFSGYLIEPLPAKHDMTSVGGNLFLVTPPAAGGDLLGQNRIFTTILLAIGSLTQEPIIR